MRFGRRVFVYFSFLRVAAAAVLFGLSHLFFAATAEAQDTILLISFHDGAAFNANRTAFTRDLYQAAFPEAQVIEIVVEVPGTLTRSFLDEKKFREHAIRQLRDKVPNDAQITHMVIGTHGRSNRDDKTTVLEHIGEFGVDGLDPKATEFFRPIRKKFSQSATIVLQSCSNFKGQDDDVALRAVRFLNHFKITDGQIFGSEINGFDAGPPGYLSPNKSSYFSAVKNSLRDLSYLLAINAGAAGIGFDSKMVPSFLTFDSFVMTYAIHVSIRAAALTLASGTALPVVRWVLKKFLLRKDSTGKIVFTQKGKVKEIRPAHFILDADQVYNVTKDQNNWCLQYLLRGQKKPQ